jgi:UDP-GlcNAc:undecaprenyl-phosphate GlcNAc-1-phosphate transferase
MAAAIAVCAIGIRIRSLVVADWLTLDFGWFSWPLTILWIVGITNAVNLSDGLDGLAAGISAVACAVIAVFAIYSGSVVMAVLMLALLGSLTGFLLFNFNPAKIFMGDCGSMFLGFTIASSSVLCSMKSSALVGLALPVLALGIPIFDTLFSMLRRYLERRSIFAPDRGHFHHRLLGLGLNQRHAVVTMYALTLFAAGLGMFMMATSNYGSLAVFFCVLLLLFLAFHVVGSVRLKETVAALKRKHAVNRHVWQERRCFEDAQLHFRQAVTFDQWWQAACNAAEQLGFRKLRLPVENGGNPDRTLTWQRDGNEADQSETLRVKIPIRGPGGNSQLNVEVDVAISGSLESAGHRAALFGRLLDEHSILSLPANESSLQGE